MKRKPCEGRNVEDSEAELYAEYHGSHDNQVMSTDPGQDDQAGPRLRRISGRSENDNLPSDRFEQFPDLKSTIELNFTRMYSGKVPNVSVTNHEEIPSTQTSVTDMNQGHGFDFKKFDGLYQEHEQYLEDKKVHDEARKHYLSLEARANRSKSWSEGKSFT